MDTELLNKAINDLQDHKDEWVHLAIKEKIDLLVQLRSNLEVAATCKQFNEMLYQLLSELDVDLTRAFGIGDILKFSTNMA